MADEGRQQCIFCQIISGEINARKIYSDDVCVVILDINPANPGHMIILPKEHYSFMPEMPEDVTSHIGMVAKHLSQAAIRGLKAQGTNVLVSNGEIAGQRALHVMIHVIPRMEGDKVVGFDIPATPLSSKDLEEARQKLTPLIKSQLKFDVAQTPILGSDTKATPALPAVPKKVASQKPFTEQIAVQQSQPAGQPNQNSSSSPQLDLDELTNFLTGGKRG